MEVVLGTPTLLSHSRESHKQIGAWLGFKSGSSSEYQPSTNRLTTVCYATRNTA